MGLNVIAPNYKEISFNQCKLLLMQNPMSINTYYSQLFSSFRPLLNEEDNVMLDNMIAEFEKYISDTFNPITLHEAEIRMFNNFDLLSGFEVNGHFITQLDMQEKLEEIKSWLTMKLYEYLPTIRFTSPVRMV